MKIVLSITLAIALVIATLLSWPKPSGQLEITMLDVGQGDAIYIRTPGEQDILIDGGPDRSVIYELGQSMPPLDHTLEWVLATHPDADHIAGIPEVAQVVDIATLITNGVPKDTVYANAVDALQPTTAQRGQTLALENELTLEFLHPDPLALHGDAYNDDSLVFIVRYRDFSMLFTGDIEESVERDLAALYTQQLDVDILKVAHHGSKTSTTPELLHATTPELALMSVGQDNRFGHPHAGTLYRLEQYTIPVLRTDQHGRITCTSDGEEYACAGQH